VVLEGVVGAQIAEQVIQAGPGMVLVKPRASHTRSGIPPTSQHAYWRPSRPRAANSTSRGYRCDLPRCTVVLLFSRCPRLTQCAQ
jgi:hypothetical protein